MDKSQNNTVRVMKNTMFLYIRMFLLAVISIITVRIVLDVLGAEDYGLYNVVAGFVGFFSFINGVLTTAAQRYFAISLAKDDWLSLSKYFSLLLIIYIIFSVLILTLSSSLGVWFIDNKLNIPIEKTDDAIIVFLVSVIAFIVNLMSSPLQSLLVADENFTVYSFVSVFEGMVKILIVYLLFILEGNKLIIYSVLLLLVTITINLFYLIYVVRKYKVLKLKMVKDKNDFFEVLGYMNWNLIGAIGQILKGQGINVIMNIFFGVTINAARGIAIQLSTVVSNFSQNFMKAIEPQIMKKYAIGNDSVLDKVLYSSSKVSFFMLYIVSFPLILGMDFIISLWLGANAPNYTIVFSKLILIDWLLISFTEPIGTAVQATGKVKYYQIFVGTFILLNLPLSYLALKISCNPLLPFYVALVLSLMVSCSRIIIFRYLNRSFSINSYLRAVLFPIGLVVLFSLIVLVISPSSNSFFSFIINSILILCYIILLIFLLGLSSEERKHIFMLLNMKKKNYE